MESSSDLRWGALLSTVTAGLLATQGPLSLLASKHFSLPKFIGVTALVLLICVPFMLWKQRAREDFRSILSTMPNLARLAALVLIGLLGQSLFAIGLGKGHPVVISAVLNLDPFWAALIAYIVLKKTIPVSVTAFLVCMVIAFIGAMMIAVSQTDGGTLSNLSLASFLGAGIALPVPILTALSGTLVGKWFGAFDESACLAVLFAMSAVVVIPVSVVVGYGQSDLRMGADAVLAVALLAVGTVLSAAVGRVIYQKALTITHGDNGFISMFFLFIPAFTCLLSLAMSPWIQELKFSAGALFFGGLGLVALPIFVFTWQSWRSAKASTAG